MENVKMEKQRTSEPYPRIMKNILSQGVRGYEAGLWPWGVVLGLTKGTVLGGSKAQITNFCRNLGMTKDTTEIVSGFGSGAVQGLFMSPILLARTRVNQSLTERTKAGHVNTSMWTEMVLSSKVLSDGVKKEGWMMLTNGMTTCVIKRALDWGSRFVFINYFRKYLQSHKPAGQGLNDTEKLATAFFGGAASVTVTMPIDRMMPVLQAAGGSNGSLVQILKEKFGKEGISTLQRGWMMRTLHTGYHTMFAIFVADKAYSMIIKE